MKFLAAGLPTLMLLGFAAVFALQTPATPVGAAPEISKLRQERQVLSEELEKLEAARHHVLPRGGL